mgnify:FL=1|jgi:hypothetical protein
MPDSYKILKTKKPRNKVSTKYKFISLLLYFLILSSTVVWANSPITINAKVDKTQVTTGDIIVYTITLLHDTDLKSSMPDFSVIEGFDILESLASEPRKAEGKIEQGYSVKLRADEVGLSTIPSIAVPFEIRENESAKPVPGEIRSPEVSVEITSVLRLQGEPADIRDIKGAVEVDRNWTPWLFWGMNLILLVICLYLFWKYRKVKHTPSTANAPVLPTHEIALRELDALKEKELLEHGEAREHFFELSEIYRRYLGARYHFPAPDWTTEEITQHFQKLKELEPSSRTEAVRILMKSDLIKFAKVQAAPGSDEIKSVRKFITSTREHLEIGLYSN